MLPSLPKWNDAQSVSLFLVAVFGFVVSTLAAFGVVVPKGLTANITVAAGIAAIVISLAVNAWTHRSAHAAAVVAATNSQPPVPPQG